ncbi:hypothetical protein [Syntrophothermus lipocalidus]|uniref:2-phosphosulfolactate phosphatase n=1 Tax=Syntrophothermus lipocalidus (strain DSM 12680 / TGB-C1) TaxID=643648 RepID=D7CKK2_SYNLT|nr:hypothetical protein [Syntrophothermus lipocalidus]ADI01237.1 conserved hypothetical protein [Syntrophothermus lipocalidus DSM 12680]
MVRYKKISVTTDASGAQQAAREGLVVMIVDVIDMSTTLESALDAGAALVLGASPDNVRVPVSVSPDLIGQEAARKATEVGTGIVIVAEPRVGSEQERLSRCQKLLAGIYAAGGKVEAVVPNMGAETPKLVSMENRVVVAVTDTGGVAFDAAFQEQATVITGTVARTLTQKGIQPALTAVRRARKHLADHRGIAIVAASRNSQEDILAAQFIASLLMGDIE